MHAERKVSDKIVDGLKFYDQDRALTCKSAKRRSRPHGTRNEDYRQ